MILFYLKRSILTYRTKKFDNEKFKRLYFSRLSWRQKNTQTVYCLHLADVFVKIGYFSSALKTTRKISQLILLYVLLQHKIVKYKELVKQGLQMPIRDCPPLFFPLFRHGLVKIGIFQLGLKNHSKNNPCFAKT